jgi:hypothetical protein
MKIKIFMLLVSIFVLTVTTHASDGGKDPQMKWILERGFRGLAKVDKILSDLNKLSFKERQQYINNLNKTKLLVESNNQLKSQVTDRWLWDNGSKSGYFQKGKDDQIGIGEDLACYRQLVEPFGPGWNVVCICNWSQSTCNQVNTDNPGFGTWVNTINACWAHPGFCGMSPLPK